MNQIMNRNRIFVIIAAVISISSFLILWQITALYTKIGVLIPTPVHVLKAFLNSFSTVIGKDTMLGHMAWSLSRVLVGFGLAALIGIIFGFLMGLSSTIKAIVMPLFQMIRPIPPIAWISMSILWFGLGESGKYLIIFIAAFSSIMMNAFYGALSVDPVLIGAAKMLGASKRKIFTTVVLPATVPYIFSGMQVAISAGWGAVVAAEMISSTQGLGWIIVNAMQVNNMTQSLVGMVAIGIIGYLLVTIMRGLESKLCAWNYRKK